MLKLRTLAALALAFALLCGPLALAETLPAAADAEAAAESQVPEIEWQLGDADADPGDDAIEIAPLPQSDELTSDTPAISESQPPQGGDAPETGAQDGSLNATDTAGDGAGAGSASQSEEDAEAGSSAQPDGDIAPDGGDAPEETPATPVIPMKASSITLGVGEKFTLTDPIAAEDGVTLQFKTSNKKIATVSAAGVIKAVKKGTATITVRLGDSATATCAVKVVKAPSKIKLNASKATLGYDAEARLGTQFQLKASLSSGSASQITYGGYSASVVSVDESGLVIATGTGTTKITAKTFNGKKAAITITVKPAPDAVALSASEKLLGLDESFKLAPSIPSGTAATFAFSSDNPDVAAVDPSTGAVKATGLGEATVTVNTFNGRTDSCRLRVVPAPDGVAISPASRTLGIGETLIIEAAAVRADGGETAGAVAWKSSNTKIATVDANGKVKAKKKGTAKITATAYNKVKATCTIKVVKAPSKLQLNRTSATLGYDAALGEGESGTLTPKLASGTASAVRYSGYDENVLRVSEDGTVTAVGFGTTKITAATFNNKKAYCTVTVKPAPETLAIEPEAIALGVKAKYTLKTVLPEGTASVIAFTSLNPEIATVNGSGVVTAVAPGEAEIWAETFNGRTASCRVAVLPAPARIAASPASLTLGVGEKSAPLAMSADVGDIYGGYTFKSAKTKVAKVSAAGVVTGVAKGSTTIKVTAYNGVSVSVPVKVVAAPKSISLSPKQVTLDLGQSARLTASYPSGQGGGRQFESSDNSVVTVAQDGSIEAVGLGSAVVSVLTYNGKPAECAVNVVTPAAEISMPDSAALVTSLYSDFDLAVSDADGNAYEGVPTVTFEPAGIAAYANGRLLGKKAGETLMTVEASGLSASCWITVVSYRSAHPVQSIGHRGASGYCPENTLESFARAAALGADGVELDVQTTKDGVQLVNHNTSITVGKKTYIIANYTYDQLKRLKPSLCTLDEALDVIDAAGMDLHLELKETADGAKCVDIVRAHGMQDRTVYFGFFDEQLKQVYAAEPSAIIGKSIASPPSQAETERLVKDLHLSFFVSKYTTTTQANVDTWHGMGLKVCIWTLNNKKDVQKFCDMGVDYILSNYPEYCAQLR